MKELLQEFNIFVIDICQSVEVDKKITKHETAPSSFPFWYETGESSILLFN
jgi:hypothetical protein